MRIALVATGEAAVERARLEAARGQGEVVVFAAPALAAQLAVEARWSAPGAALVAPVERLLPSAAARAALLEAGRFDEIRFAFREGAGWATALLARQRQDLQGARVVVEVQPADDELLRPLALGDTYLDLLLREACLQALRDADEVRGDPAALQQLREKGAVPGPAPRQPVESAATISAVVTHKDLERYLPECLASLRAQTVPVEIILVDDGSGEPGLAVVRAEAARDPALKVICHPNQGVAASRNAGLRAATGELVLIVDADNTLRPRFAERLRQALHQRPDADAAVPAFRTFDDRTGLTLEHYCPAELCAPTLFITNTAGDACAMHRRERLLEMGGFVQDGVAAEDWELWFRYAERGRTTAAVPEVLFDYRVRPASMWREHSERKRQAVPFQGAELHRTLLSSVGREVAVLAATQHFDLLADLRWREGQRGLEVAREQARAAQAEQEGAAREAQAAEREAAALARAAGSEAREQAALQLAAQRLVEARAEARARAEAQAAFHELGAHAARVEAALEEMTRSSAVRLARLVRSLSPAAHRRVGSLARRLLGRLRG